MRNCSRERYKTNWDLAGIMTLERLPHMNGILVSHNVAMTSKTTRSIQLPRYISTGMQEKAVSGPEYVPALDLLLMFCET